MEKEEITYYELNPSQEVVKLQCTYSLFKRVINILTSASTEKEIDFKLLEKAFNIAVERNDCTRIQFVKRKGKLMQYFRKQVVFKDIPVLEFKTKEEQDAFIEKESIKPIKYMKGEVIKPTFIKTYDGLSMVFFKVCHLVFDIYGLNVFTQDLFGIYDALKNGTDLPVAPKKFEDLIKKDIEMKHDKEKSKRDYDYFKKLLSENPEPYYAGVDGGTNKWIQKARKKNRRPSPFFIMRNDTKLYGHSISKEVCDKLLNCAKETQVTIANLLFYIFSVTQSRLNGDVPSLLPLELCNVRGTLLERKAAGTKAQSLLCYTKVDKDKSFIDNLNAFMEIQNENYRHIGMKDLDAQMLIHDVYKTSLLEIYYSIAYSFIPIEKTGDIKMDFYTNGKCALPLYVAVLYDYKNNTIDIGYDAQVQLVSEQNVAQFHKNLISCIEQVSENPNMLVKDIQLEAIK